MSEPTQSATCPEPVWKGGAYSGGYKPCGKPVKRRDLCGIHARSADLDDARKARRQEQVAAEARAGKAAAALTERLGVAFYPDYRGGVGISTEDAEALLVKLSAGDTE